MDSEIRVTDQVSGIRKTMPPMGDIIVVVTTGQNSGGLSPCSSRSVRKALFDIGFQTHKCLLLFLVSFKGNISATHSKKENLGKRVSFHIHLNVSICVLLDELKEIQIACLSPKPLAPFDQTLSAQDILPRPFDCALDHIHNPSVPK